MLPRKNGISTLTVRVNLSCRIHSYPHHYLYEELRNIEVIVQARSGVEGLESGEKEMIDKIQEILYSTEVRQSNPACLPSC